MSTKNIGVGLAVLVLIGGGVAMFNSKPSSSPSKAMASAASSISASTTMKFADQPYAQYAYLIDPANLNAMDAATKAAVAGFMITAQKAANGTVTVKLTSQNTEYHDQSYILSPGEKLYFIEKNLGDDQNGTERFLGDDTAVVVDQNGTIVNQNQRM